MSLRDDPEQEALQWTTKSEYDNALNRARLQYGSDPLFATRIRDIESKFPGMRSSLVLAAAQAGLQDDQISTLYDANLRVDSGQKDSRWSGGFFSDAIAAVRSGAEFGGRGLKTTSRLLTATAAAPLELTMGLVRSGVSAIGEATGDTDVFGQDLRGGWRNPFAQVQLFQALVDPTDDQGSGWFMGGKIAEQAVKAQREAAQLRGADGTWHALTLGRSVFGAVPGSTGRILSGLVDASISLVGDPGNIVFPVVGKIPDAANVFRGADSAYEAAGIVNGFRTVVHGQTARAWLDSDKGQQVINAFAGTSSPATIWRAFNGKLDAATVTEIANKTDPLEIRKILDRRLGIDVMDKPSEIIDGSKLVRRTYRPSASAWRSQMNATFVDPNDHEDLILQFDRMMSQARVSLDKRDKALSSLIAADGPNQKYNAIKKIVNQTIPDSFEETRKFRPGITAPQRDLYRQWLQLWTDEVDNSRQYAIDAMGKPVDDIPLVIGSADEGLRGMMVAVGANADVVEPNVIWGHGPLDYNELLSNKIVLPHGRDLRRMSSVTRRLTALSKLDDAGEAFNAWDATLIAALDKGYGAFRFLQLIRPGAVIRNVAEAQASMAVNGQSTFFNHPLDYIGWAVARAGKEASVRTVTGRNWQDEFAEGTSAISKTLGRTFSEEQKFSRRKYIGGYRQYHRDHKYFPQAWAEEVARMSRDPMERAFAEATKKGDIQDLKNKFWEDPGYKKFREELFDPAPVKAGEQARLRQMLNTREGSDAYIDDYLSKRQGWTTSSDSVLMNAIADGYLKITPKTLDKKQFLRNVRFASLPKNDRKLEEAIDWQEIANTIFDSSKQLPTEEIRNSLKELGFNKNTVNALSEGRIRLVEANGKGPSKGLVAYLRRQVKAGNGPEWALGRNAASINDRNHVFSKTADAMWNWFYTVPSNQLANIPGFKQLYADELVRLQAYVDDSAKSAISKYVPKRKNALGFKVSTQATDTALPEGVERLTLAEADKIAQRRAVDRAKKIFYDLANDDKAGAWDAMRYIAPFGQAWANSLTRWAKYTAKNPMILRRLHQGLEGAQELQIPGVFDNGLVVEDPTTGEMTIAMPFFGSALSGGLTGGIPVGLTGRVAGLNMIANVYPGVGPVIQLPVELMSSLLPQVGKDNPAWTAIKDFIAPYSTPDDNAIEKIINAFSPGWADRVMTAFSATTSQRRVLANQVANNIVYLSSTMTPEQLADPQELSQMVNKAIQAAKTQFFVRGIVQAVAPTAPSFDPKVKLKDGRIASLYVMSKLASDLEEQFRSEGMQDPGGAATTAMLAMYGDTLYTMMQPKSYSRAYGVEPTAEFEDFYMKNPQAFDKYEDTAGLFFPGGGEFDLKAYGAQFSRSERVSYFDGKPNTFENWIALAQHRQGQIIYRQQLQRLAQLGLSESPVAQQMVKREIYRLLPGWQRRDIVGTRYKMDTPDAIAQLERMAEDPQMQTMPGMESLKEYLQVRRSALLAMQQAGLTVEVNGRLVVSDSKQALPIRLELLRYGQRLMLADPYFTRVWSDLLGRESNIMDAYDELAGVDAMGARNPVESRG